LTIEKPKKHLISFYFGGKKSPEEKTLALRGALLCIVLELVLGPKK
jgi:hypothetical protein